MDTYDIMVKNQFGLKKNIATYMAMMLFMGEIKKSLEDGDNVIGVFLDVPKAFDTVDDDMLLRKLHHHWLCGNALRWFKKLFEK